MKLIVGLGNPGVKYQLDRHNVGFMVVDTLSRQFEIEIKKRSFKALIGLGTIEKVMVVLAKPQTYMNLSGESVSSLLSFYKLGLKDLIVVHDDIDLGLGRIKIAKSSGDAGHRGVRSIIEALGSKEFTRIRFGVGRPPEEFDSKDYVLERFNEEERKIVQETILLVIENIREFILSS